MKKRFFITVLFAMSFVAISVFGATVNFYSTTDVKIDIYAPIDNGCNNYFISDRLTLKPHLSISYKFSIEDFCFIQLKYSNGRKYIILLEKDDELSLHSNGDKIFCEGSNSAGISYFNSKYVSQGLIRYTLKIDSIFEQNIGDKISCESITQDLQDSFFDSIFSEIGELEKNHKVSHHFATILRKNLQYAFFKKVISNYSILLSGKKGQITHADSIYIKNQIDSIYFILSPEDEQIIKYNYGFGFVSQYFGNKYKDLSSLEKNKLIHKYDEDTFGPYSPFLLAPDAIQLSALGAAFFVQFNYMVNEFSKDKMIKYLEEKFPNSQYLKLIKERLKEIKTDAKLKHTTSNDSIIIINKQINTLKELTSLDLLKDTCLYIDLWATWCIPCRMEFSYKDELYPVAKKHNVKLVYISIDKADSKKKWEADVFEQNLKGYHLLANEYLLKNIKKNIYKDRTISIPRYLFINEKGEIVNDDAPRPSSISKIEEMFSGK